MGKISLAAGFGAGYVLGARAGRSRYDQISQSFSQLMRNPKVQQTRETVQNQATGLIGKGKERVGSKAASRKQGGDQLDTSYDVVEIPESTTGTTSSTGTTGSSFGSTTGTTGTTGTEFGTPGTSGFGTTGTSTDRPTTGL